MKKHSNAGLLSFLRSTSLKPVFLISFISVLPLSQMVDTTKNIYTTESPVFHFATATDNIFPASQKEKTAPGTDELKQSDWYSDALKNIEKKEYRFNKLENSNSYTTPNRKNNLRFNYDENGFSVEPRTTQIPLEDITQAKSANEIKYKTLPNWKVNFQLDKKQIGKGLWEINENKAEYKTATMTVQYINNEEGMRQNFIVQKPLTDDKNLKLNFSVKTKLHQRFNSDRLQFAHPESGVVLNYEQLKVWDADGNILAAAFEKNNNDYCIHVNTMNATYPITIDPISTTAAAMVESNQASAQLGYSVASAGDVNGDGYSDVIVGAPQYYNGGFNEGAAFIYHGSATGVNTTAASMIESNQDFAQLGWAAACAGDVNGDGYSDVIVGANLYDNGQNNEGAVFVYHGSAAGINTTAVSMVESNQDNANMGFSVASVGDVNGDGYSDVIVGAYRYGNGQAGEGAAFVYHGSAAGINITAASIIERNQADANMGWSVSSAGDVNGDGYSDVMVGAPNYDNGQISEGAAFIYHGSATGINTAVVFVVESSQLSANMGWSVSSAGDVNGDGYSDIIVGAPGYAQGQSGEGVAFIYHGSATGINTTAASILENNQANAQMGWSVASAGDVNGDGYSDVIVGAPLYDNGQNEEGTISIYYGSNTGINITAVFMVESDQVNANMGRSVASAGDVNGDGYSDVIAGAYRYDNGETNEGAAFIYHGSAAGLNTTAAVVEESNQVDANLGWSVAGAGDVNGDGYSDVIVGAQFYDNGENNEGAAFIYHGSATGVNTIAAARVESNQANANLGWSVASAGDVNGDGYSDVIVGAYRYANGQADEGAAFIYHGSATGVNTIAAVRVESNQADAQLGYSVDGAGDVNGDGYSDVIAGAHRYNNGQSREGAAFIYHGSATGVNATAAARVESDQLDVQLGYSVAGAGDVNGDGYSDVIVGVPFYDAAGQIDEGVAFVYHGSSSGINTIAVSMVESNQADARLGYSVARAGDVNGDGYSDVIVGVPFYNNVAPDKGAAFIYHGSSSGINTIAVSMVESNQADARLGYSVAGAGDVNGDGYGDVVVGAYLYDNGQTSEGAAFMYHGSATGINTTVATLLESNQDNAQLGWSVAGAGDVNGDGYSDVMAGAPLYDNGENNEGAAFIYHGNGATTSKRNNLKLYNSNLTTPVSSANFNLANFGAGLFAKSFLGRTKGKLVWETRLNYNPYSGTPITNSAVYTSQQNTYTNLGLAGTELKNLVAKRSGRYTKIRARVKYDPVTAITGQLYGPWRYVPEQIAGQSLGVLPVDLISFKAAWQQEGKTAKIDFTTDNETAICCYEIEKSSDGLNFNTIEKLIATNTSTLYTYHFIDNNATGKKIYYRLKTIHNSGDIDYSNIQLLQNNTAVEILVFPNPATDVLQLQLNRVYDKVDVQIVNVSGQVVKQISNLAAANQTVKIPLNNLASGTYFLYLQSGEEKQVLQFVKK